MKYKTKLCHTINKGCRNRWEIVKAKVKSAKVNFVGRTPMNVRNRYIALVRRMRIEASSQSRKKSYKSSTSKKHTTVLQNPALSEQLDNNNNVDELDADGLTDDGVEFVELNQAANDMFLPEPLYNGSASGHITGKS